MTSLRAGFLTILLAFSASQTVPAEWLEFVEGGSAQLEIAVKGDSVEVFAPGGPYHFLREDFRRIEPIPWPETAWPDRKAKALEGGAEARTEAAGWALDRGLAADAAAMFREAHEADAEAQPARRCVSALDRLEAPCPSPDLEPIRRALGGRFEAIEGAHVVLLHQHDADEAVDRLAFLETIVTAYHLEFARLGFDLPAPRHKLPVAWFASKADYQAYLRKEGASAFLSTRGYHHPVRGLVAFYDARSDPESQQGRKDLEARLSELEALERGVGRMTARDRVRLSVGEEPPRMFDRKGAEKAVETLRRRIDRQKLLGELRRLKLDLGTAAHEMVHLLVASSRLSPRPGAFPHWLNEGLAMQFEAVRGDRWAGLGVPSPLRREDWRDQTPSPALEPVLRDVGLGQGYRQGPYAAAWALVYDLRTHEPSAFVALIDRLRLPGVNPEAEPSSGRVVEAFTASVGVDLPTYQAGWHDRMGRLPAWGQTITRLPPSGD